MNTDLKKASVWRVVFNQEGRFFFFNLRRSEICWCKNLIGWKLLNKFTVEHIKKPKNGEAETNWTLSLIHVQVLWDTITNTLVCQSTICFHFIIHKSLTDTDTVAVSSTDWWLISPNAATPPNQGRRHLWPAWLTAISRRRSKPQVFSPHVCLRWVTMSILEIRAAMLRGACRGQIGTYFEIRQHPS